MDDLGRLWTRLEHAQAIGDKLGAQGLEQQIERLVKARNCDKKVAALTERKEVVRRK